jgi:predicted kinase
MLNVTESIDDASLFKAVLMIGGPGSGKSYIIKNIFKDKVKVISSDAIFEFLLKKHNLPLKIDKNNDAQYAQQMNQRNKAIQLLKTPVGNYINGMLPLVVDGTGKNFKKIEMQKKELEEIGYDVYCIMVNTTLEVAKQRNLKRARSVPSELVSDAWNEVQHNLGKYSQMFGNNFLIVDNNDKLNMEQLNRIESLILNSKLKNRIGNEVVNWLKSNNKSYYSDYIKKDFSITLEEKIKKLFVNE